MRFIPLRLLLVTQYYRPELIGSAPFCTDIAEWLAQQGREVTVLTGLPHYPSAEAFPEYAKRPPRRETLAGVRVERLGSRLPGRRTARARITGEAAFLAKGLWAIATGRARRHRLVLSLCPSVLSVALGALARKRGGHHVALVHDIQSGLARGLGMVGNPAAIRVMRAVERTILNRVDLVVVLTAEMAEQLRELGVAGPIEIVPIWVDTDRVRPMAISRVGPLRVLYSGNFGKKQGLEQILALAQELARRGADLVITMRGDGSQAGWLKAALARSNLSNVILDDLVPAASLNRSLAEGDVHLVPQEPDVADFAVPSKIYNIMAAARPFVATAREGSPLWRLAQASQAFLCTPPNDAPALADAVLGLANDSAARRTLGNNGRRYVERECAKARILGHLMNRLDSLYVGR